MRILDILIKDLSQILRDRRSLLFLVAMPVVFTLFMGVAYRGGGSNSDVDARLVLAWVDQDSNAPLSAALAQNLARSAVLRVEAMPFEAAETALRRGEAAAALIIPPGFSAGQLRGDSVQLELVLDASTTSGQSAAQALSRPVTQVLSALHIAQIHVRAMQEQDSLPADQAQAELQAAFDAALAHWAQTDNAARLQVQLAAAQEQSDFYGDNPYNQASPGILVMFAIFSLNSSAQIIVLERKNRTLARMLTTSLSPAAALAGHFLAMMLLTLLQQLLLVAFGQWVLSVDYLRAPLGVLAVMLTLSLATGSLGLLISVYAKEEQQVVLYAMVAMFVFSALGGVWFPLETAGQAFGMVGRLTPAAWAMTGFQNILIRGLGSASAFGSALALLGYASGFFALAAWRFSRPGSQA